MKIYLAGSTTNDWRKDFEIYFPDTFEIMEIQSRPLSEIAKIEIDWLYDCEGVLAWFPENNLSGIGLSFELGFAKSIYRPTVLLVDWWHERTKWLRHTVDFATDNKLEAVNFLDSDFS